MIATWETGPKTGYKTIKPIVASITIATTIVFLFTRMLNCQE